jgi:uncharacterized protein YndB with AHSA1/START domain
MNPPPVIQLDHVYAHPPSAVWRILTTPELHAKWWAPGDVRPVVGHKFDLDMGPWGKQPCEVTEVENERLFRYRFAIGSLNTTITWRLEPLDHGTRLTLTQEGFDMESPMGRRAYEGMKPGWPGILAKLDRMLGEG